MPISVKSRFLTALQVKPTSSDRTFGLVMGAVFLLLGLLPLVKGHPPRLMFAGVAVLFALAALLRPRILSPLNKAWTMLGLLLHSIMTPVIMALVFFVVLLPIALMLRIAGKDLLQLKQDAGRATYWGERGANAIVFTQQF